MKVIALMVASVDGKTTQANSSNIYSWTSEEDQEQFFAAVRSAQLIVMGRKTWQAARDKIVLRPETLRIVLTARPDQYTSHAVLGQLEFSAEQPTELVKRAQGTGYSELLLVGGSQVVGAFLQAGLVTDLRLTIEPLLFGTGVSLIPELPVVRRLQLVSVQQLNARGTLLLQYSVENST